MKIAWYTPFSAQSAIGRYSHLVVRALRNAGADVQIVRSETKSSAMRSQPPICREERWIWAADIDRDPVTALAACDLVIYNIGDHYEFHQYCFNHQSRNPGVAIVHDFSLHHALHQHCLATQQGAGGYRAILEAEHDAAAGEAYADAVANDRMQDWWDRQIAAYPVYRWALRGCLGAVTHAGFYRAAVGKSLGCPTTSIPLAYDSPVDGEVAARLSEPSPSRPLRLLTVGAVNPNKRYAAIIATLAGSSVLRERYEYRAVGALGSAGQSLLAAAQAGCGNRPHVKALGEVDRPTLCAELTQADVISCLRFPALEGASASVVEGLLTGKPVIVSQTGCYAEIPDDLVYKVDPQREQRDLEDVLLHIAKHPGEARDRARRARAWAEERHAPATYARQLLDFCAQVLHTRPSLKTVDRIAAQLREWNVAPNATLAARLDRAMSLAGFSPSGRVIAQLHGEVKNAPRMSNLPIPVLVSAKVRRRQHEPVHCAFQDFHEPEGAGDKRYLWTKERSTLDCSFARPTRVRHVWLEIEATSPQGSFVSVLVDGQPLQQNRWVRGRRTMRIAVPEAKARGAMELGIVCSTFRPCDMGGDPADVRDLGIALRGVVFGKRRLKYLAGSLFRKPLRARVEKLMGKLWRRAA